MLLRRGRAGAHPPSTRPRRVLVHGHRGTAGATEALAPAMLNPRRESIFSPSSPQYLPRLDICRSPNFQKSLYHHHQSFISGRCPKITYTNIKKEKRKKKNSKHTQIKRIKRYRLTQLQQMQAYKMIYKVVVTQQNLTV